MFTRWVQREELGGSGLGPTNQAKARGGEQLSEADRGAGTGGRAEGRGCFVTQPGSGSLPVEAFEGRVTVVVVGSGQI